MVFYASTAVTMWKMVLGSYDIVEGRSFALMSSCLFSNTFVFDRNRTSCLPNQSASQAARIAASFKSHQNMTSRRRVTIGLRHLGLRLLTEYLRFTGIISSLLKFLLIVRRRVSSIRESSIHRRRFLWAWDKMDLSTYTSVERRRLKHRLFTPFVSITWLNVQHLYWIWLSHCSHQSSQNISFLELDWIEYL